MKRKTEVEQEQDYWRELSDRLGWVLVAHNYKSEVTYRDQWGYQVELTRRQRDTIVAALHPKPSDVVVEAARKFLDKVDEVGRHVNHILGVQTARGYPYTGPNWGVERDALAALLPEREAKDAR